MVFIHVIIDVGVQEFCMLRYRHGTVTVTAAAGTVGTGDMRYKQYRPLLGNLTVSGAA